MNIGEDIWFQQNGTTPDFANDTIELLRQKFPKNFNEKVNL